MTPTTNIDAYEKALALVTYLQTIAANPPVPVLQVDTGTPSPSGSAGGSFVYVLPVGPGDVSEKELITVLSSAKSGLFIALAADAQALADTLKPQALADAQAIVSELK